MLDHVPIEADELARSREFYGPALECLGYGIVPELKGIVVAAAC